MEKTLSDFKAVVDVVAKLRSPDGCPWDKEQTQTSLTQYIIEESFELVEALESGDQKNICEELGDFLFQAILQAQVAKDAGYFELSDVLQTLAEKMIRRHPHVFGNDKSKTIEEVWQKWHQLKAEEQGAKKKPLFNYPRQMPALQAAMKIGKKTEGYKFDWNDSTGVLNKIDEELAETKKAIRDCEGQDAIEHEIGDVLFTVAQLARHQDLDPEAALRKANRRFEARFSKALALSQKSREDFAALPAEQKEELWRQVKAEELKTDPSSRTP